MEKEQYVDTVKDRQYGLFISRVPPNTRKRFLELASEADFCSDFGMALKFLCDFHDGLIPSGMEHLEAQLQELREKIAAIEAAQAEKKEEIKPKTRLNGKEVMT